MRSILSQVKSFINWILFLRSENIRKTAESGFNKADRIAFKIVKN